MKTLAIVLVAFAVCYGQNDDDQERLSSIFSTPDTSFLAGYEVVSSTTQGSFGALDKCGEGANAGVNICVPYYNCDGETNFIVVDENTSGVGLIDIRFGSNSCDHYLDICCMIPEGGIPPGFNSTAPPPTNPPTQATPPTRPPTKPTRPQTGGQVTPPTPPVVVPTQPSTQWGGFCGIRNVNGIDFKITGAQHGESEYGEFPWMVAILRKNFNPETEQLMLCGGSLIGPNVVITGAHCVHNRKTHDIKIRAGEWDTQTEKERLPYQERNVVDIIMRKDFNAKTLFNDVALLILDTPLIKADNLGTVCMPPSNAKINSNHCFASGWGKTNFGHLGAYSVILKKIELPTVPFKKCENALKGTRLGQRFVLHESFMCAGGQEGVDTCEGDGGSPLVCPDPRNPQRYVLAGMVAWGIGCGGEGIPGVYVDVAKFRHWVDEELSKRGIPHEPYNV